MPLNQQDARECELHREAPGRRAPASAAADVQWADIAGAVDRMLVRLEGQDLDYCAFGRSTPRGRSCVCRVLHASAKLAYLPGTSQTAGAAVNSCCGSEAAHAQGAGGTGHTAAGSGGADAVVPVVCVQLVADRFVRRMVRTLVSTAVMSAIWDEPLRLQQALAARERRDTAYPAPAAGLCFTGAGYHGEPARALEI